MNKQTSKGFQGEYEFLSNFYPCKINYMGLEFESVEIAFQSAKCELFSEAQMFTKFTASDSGKAKRLGKKIRMRADWEQVKLGVMEELLRMKFSDSKLSSRLIDTSGIELVEFNYWGDHFYGVCKGVGRNELGKLLMKIREELCLLEKLYSLYTFISETSFKFTKRNYNRNNILKELVPHIYYQMCYWKNNNVEMDSYNAIQHLLDRKISNHRKILMLDKYSKTNKYAKLAYYLRFDEDSKKYRWGEARWQ